MIDFRDEELELLPNQGYCNLNYLLQKEGKKYHVRKFRLADRDRELEFKIQHLAYKKGIAPKPFYMDKSIMIGAFVEGKHKKKLRQREIHQLALVVQKLHKIKIRQKPMTFNKSIERKRAKFKKDLVLCHGDLSVNNILFSKRITLIDWEYAGVVDRYFDLACVCKEFGFSSYEEQYFLRNYWINAKKVDIKKLTLYKEIYEALTKEWFEKLDKNVLDFLS